MDGLVISRDDASARGMARFFTGKPCRNGHVAERTIKGVCVKCNVASSARSLVKWAAKNPDRLRKIRLKAARKYRLADPERSNKQSSDGHLAWRKSNPERYRAFRRVAESARRARKRNAGGTHSLRQIDNLLKKQKGKCASCGSSPRKAMEADHIMPLALGGDNSIGNIQMLCSPCNQRKQSKHPIEWARQNGRLL